MTAVILAFKAPERDRPSQPPRDASGQALILAGRRRVAARLEAQQRNTRGPRGRT